MMVQQHLFLLVAMAIELGISWEKGALQILSQGILRWPLSPKASETCYYLPYHGTEGENYSNKDSAAPIHRA